MAYLNQQEEDEQAGQGLNTTLAPQPGTPPSTTPEPTTPPPAPQGTGGAVSSPLPSDPNKVNAKAGSGSFTNLRNYLQANQGNRISSAASQQVKNTATGAKEGIAQAGSAFGNQLEAGSLANRDTAVQDVKNITQSARQVGAQAANVKNPTYLAEDQSKRFGEVINAEYKGPQSLRDAGLYEPVAQKANTAQRVVENTKTAQGREELLSDMFGRNRDYTRGQNKLDSLLLNTSETGIQDIQKEAENAGDLGSQLETAQNMSGNQAASRTKEILDLQNAARTAFSTGQDAQGALVEARLTAMTTKPVLDAKGKPVLRTDGKPMTEWDRLPEHFKKAIKDRQATNKAGQSRELGLANTKYAPILKQEDSAKKSYEAAKNAQDNAVAELKAYDHYFTKSGAYTNDADRAAANRFRQKLIAANNGEQPNNKETQALLEKFKQEVPKLQASVASLGSQLATRSKSADVARGELSKIQGTNLNQLKLSADEAAMLGIGAGEGFYNLGTNLIKTTNADKTRLVSRDEVARQDALAQLAGTDLQSRLNDNKKYGMNKAGTQDSLDALDTVGIRKLLNAEQAKFAGEAKGANLIGAGQKKVSRGNLWGKSTETYYAEAKANAAKLLKGAGYDVNTPERDQKSIMTEKDALRDYLGAIGGTNRGQVSNIGGKTTEGAVAGAGTGAAIGAMTGTGAVGAGIGAIIGGTAGAAVGGNTLDTSQAQINVLNELGDKGVPLVGEAGRGLQDLRNYYAEPTKVLGNVVGGSAGRAIGGVSSAISGIDKGAMRDYGNSMAQDLAQQDLKDKYAAFLNKRGFDNRVSVAETKESKARAAALKKIMGSRDLTNV
jgi:hypothetical protein